MDTQVPLFISCLLLSDKSLGRENTFDRTSVDTWLFLNSTDFICFSVCVRVLFLFVGLTTVALKKLTTMRSLEGILAF